MNNKVSAFKGGGQTVEIGILGYQFPELTNASHDSNWLITQLKINHPNGNFECTDPCLLTRDVEDLIDWLTKLSAHQPTPNKIGFIEPNISFAHHGWVNNELSLTIILQAEFIPPWVNQSEDEYTVDVSLCADELDGVINSLRHQYEQFPKRGGW